VGNIFTFLQIIVLLIKMLYPHGMTLSLWTVVCVVTKRTIY